MFHEILKKIETEFSSARAMANVAHITQYHRVKASPGFRSAAKYAAETLTAAGFTPETHSFRADGKTLYLSYISPEEWRIERGELWLTEPRREKLADFLEDKVSVIERSAACQVEAPVVLLNDGEERTDYTHLDVSNRIVLTKGNLMRVYELAVEERGAIGIVYDGVKEIHNLRDRFTLPDAIGDVRFSWTPRDKKCFGFTLSPRKGELLREAIREGEKTGRACRLKASVDASFKEGHFEVVSAFIPGVIDEEVWLVAHLCHPQPSANDNASGASVVLESARTLLSLVTKRKLPRPSRGLRFLLVPEILGTCAYLSSRDTSKVIAGCNLDMVGQNQSLCGSVFLIERPPNAAASFVDSLMRKIREELMCKGSPPHGTTRYPLISHAITPFTGGSDHAILSDPMVGIPAPMLIQWPDRFYHTNHDTLDKVDPAALGLAGICASTFAYFLANADEEAVNWLLNEMTAELKSLAVEFFHTKLTDKSAMEPWELEALKKLLYSKVDSLKRLGPVQSDRAKSRLRRFVKSELNDALSRGTIVATGDKPLNKWEKKASELVPCRLQRAIADLRSHRHRLTKKDKNVLHALRKKYAGVFSQAPVLAQFWMDGRRSLLEIARLVEFETRTTDVVRFLLRYFEVLSRIDLIRLDARK